MKRVLILWVATCWLTACVSIPQETITLSKTLGQDLTVLQNTHRALVNLYYQKIEDDINRFINDTYAPFVIHYVLNQQLTAYQAGDTASIYAVIEQAGKTNSKSSALAALNDMTDFQEAAWKQINKKRMDLITPIDLQKDSVVRAIDQAYAQALQANNAITTYLQSVRNVKDTQAEALSMIGLKGAGDKTIQTLVNVSNTVAEAVQKAEDIDVKTDEAEKQIENITAQIKKATSK